MGYGALVTIGREYDLCRVDDTVRGSAYAWFDVEDPAMEIFYPASLAVTVLDDGTVEVISPDLVECIVNADWETRGY